MSSEPAHSARLTDARLKAWSDAEVSKAEDEYRAHHLVYDRARARWFLLIMMAGFALFTISDYRLFGWSTAFAILVAVRVGAIVACGAALYGLGSVNARA